MPLMTQIRNHLSKAFAVLAVFFIAYMVLDWGMDLTGRKGRLGNQEIIGDVNGKEIDYRNFSEAVRRTLDAQKKQTGSDADEETERQVRSQVWSQMVDQILFEQEIKRLGITVTNQEIIDWVQGPNPPEMLVNQFKDSTGTFRRDAYYAAMRDPQNKQAWIQVEEVLRQQRMQEKLQSLLLASVRVTEPEIRERFLDKSESLDAQFVLFDVNRLVADSEVTITDDDLKSYYNNHQEDFAIKAARKLKYVSFKQAPSADDTAVVLKDMQHLKDQTKSGMDFLELAKTYSDNPVTEAFFKHSEMSKVKDDAVFSAKKGDIVGPILDTDGYHLIKILDERQGTKDFVRARHILLNLVSGPDSVKVIQRAKDLAREARSGVDFAELAKKNSQDFGAANSGGDLGWGSKGTWVKPFEDAAFRAKVGEVVGPVRTPFGWHIIKVTGRDKREVKIADLMEKIKASNKTTDDALSLAQDFASLSKDEGFEKSAELSRYEVLETPSFPKGNFVPGVGVSDAVMNFAFLKKLGSISDPISISNAIAVFKISDVRDDGVRPFDDVKATIRVPVLRQKKLAKSKDQVDRFYASLAPASDLIAAAAQLQNVTAMRTGVFSRSGAVNGVGRDPKFIGEALTLKQDEISKPFDGIRGYYIIKLISKTPIDTARFAAEHSTLRDQILQEKKSRLVSDWLTALRAKADIVDDREKFYR
jgi:peptidyl-prolyl cis-trans isomerase D